MLQERHATDKVFEDVFQRIHKIDPVLAKIDGYLEDEELLELIKTDLSGRHPKTM